MAQVQIEVPRLGVEFQGVAALPLVGSWLDASGVPLDPALPVIAPTRLATEFSVMLRVNNPNDVAALITTLTFASDVYIDSVSVSLPATIPANSAENIPVTLTFKDDPAAGETTFFDTDGVADTFEA